MSTLNTSNITVPSVATMTQHLVDSNPHPQYLLDTELLSAVSAKIHLGDLADVTLGSGIPNRSLIVYDNGTWSNVTATELWASEVIPYATTTTQGVVKLTASAEVFNVTDFSTVITPGTLDAWGKGKSFVSSGNFRQIMTEVFSASTVKVPAKLEQMDNFTWTAPISAGQVMMLSYYDNGTGSAAWTNSSITTLYAKADETSSGVIIAGNYGTVKIASEEEVLSGTSKTFEEMQSSGHSVPSLASLNSLFGTRFVSRVATTSEGTSINVYSSIVGHGVTEGTTGSGIVTIVNNNGLLIDHVITGALTGSTVGAGEVVAQAGSVISATIGGIKNGELIARGALDIISTGTAYNVDLGRFGVLNVGTIDSSKAAIASGVTASYGITPHSKFLAGYDYYTRTGTAGAYIYTLAQVVVGSDVTANTYYHKYIGGNGKVTDVYMSGCYLSGGEWVGGSGNEPFNTVNVVSNGLVHQLINGAELNDSSAAAVQASGLKQGTVNVNRDGTIEHVRGNALTQLNVNASGKVYHATLSGLAAGLTVQSDGYVEDCVVYSGAVVTVSSGGTINGLTIFENASIIVEPAGKVLGMIKYAPCYISSGKSGTESAYIQKVQFVKEDLLIYSNAVSSNVMSSSDSGTKVFFTASAHPVGLRRESAGATTTEHKFYPMAVETRVPNADDSELNDYTINAEGLSVWTDLANTAVTWYVAF